MRDKWPQVDSPGSEALLLELLDMPISFHRCFVTLTGMVTAALLLSYLLWCEEEVGPESARWLARPLELLRDATGLSRDELATARRTLRELGILEERRTGMPPRIEFRVVRYRVAQLLVERVGSGKVPRPGSMAEVQSHGILPH